MGKQNPCRIGKYKVNAQKMYSAIKGSYGITKTIAGRAGVTQKTVLKRIRESEGEDWDRCRELLEEEKASIVDDAESNIAKCIRDSDDEKLRVETSWKVLQTKGRDRGYGKETKTIIEGGDKPIHTQASVIDFNMVEKHLSIECKKEILAAIEKIQNDNNPQ